MSDALRARILEALVSAPSAGVYDDAEGVAEHTSRPHRRHDKHNYHAFCAICQGEAETLADAVIAVVNKDGPDDLDQFVREQAAASPEFAAATVEAQHAAKVRAFEDLLGDIWLYINWRYVTKQLTTEQKNLFADAVDASGQRIADADGRSGNPSRADRWWAQ